MKVSSLPPNKMVAIKHPEGYLRHRIKNSYQLEHRMVVEKHIGRQLTKDEIVHHINEDKIDNRIENLQIMSFEEHARHHARKADLIELKCHTCQTKIIRRLKDHNWRIANGNKFITCSRRCTGQIIKTLYSKAALV